MRARSGSGGSGGPAAKGLDSLHSASRSGDRSYRTFVRTSSSSRRRGSILGFKKAGFSLIQMRLRHRTKVRIESRSRFWWEQRPAAKGLDSLHFASRPGGRSYRDRGFPVQVLVGAAAPPRRVWTSCILLRGQATAPTGIVDSRFRFWWERRPRRDGRGSVHSASRPGGRSHQVGACSPWLLVFDKVDQSVG